MTAATATIKRDYSLIGPSGALAAEQGLVAAEWYHTDVPRKRMKQLMRREDAPAIRDTVIWCALLVGFGLGGYWFWGSWACVPFFLGYGVLYGSASDSRWHETGHGTAFKTQWLNDAVYQVASFMNMKEATFWRWSHARHHTDTIVVGRDREIAAMRPPDVLRLAVNLTGIREAIRTVASVGRHAAGRVTAEEVTFIPDTERRRVYREARVWTAIYLTVIAAAIYLGSWLPLMYIGLPTLYGFWLGYLFGVSQHAGLAENVLDHRLNSRTIYMNPLFRYLYWNMNYHVEHHMFPMVPYHALPQLHAELGHDMPAPYTSLIAAYREILPTLWRQLRHPDYYVRRELPASASPFRPELHQVVFEARGDGSLGAG
jgi:fatty acid desaturase